ncbi:peptidoglycan-binding LysM protein [Candidatus Nitrosoglobus terrae]|uniref:Peptidoglycan-binding LysM protein n=1 Tax=Candidatus Nitrosoglobus terrae TaxID=1630141 RepID=A0A1Q2SPC9_9GAMM|nr:peptidoglycan-binding protein [Candidatus Nitrosoglobus terrae]BAW81015.1 peptidoglycan-binding LysM protein [Candidatus Nitrosoglobus terrae]
MGLKQLLIITLLYIIADEVWGDPTIHSASPPHNFKLESRQILPLYKLSPKTRILKSENSAVIIPMEAIQQFLLRSQVVTEETLENAPYIVAGVEGRLTLGAGDEVYARGVSDAAITEYGIYREGEAYRDPDYPDKILGYEAIFIADGKVHQFGDPATLAILSSKQEVLIGDRLLPVVDQELEDLSPHTSSFLIKGKIISIVEGISELGQHQVVALNLGVAEGIEKGLMFTVYRSGETISDFISPLAENKVQLPNKRVGEIIVFSVFDHVSYGLVMRSEQAIYIYDIVSTL